MPQFTSFGLVMIPLCLFFWNNVEKLLSIAVFSTAFGAASVLNLKFGGYELGIIPPYFPGLLVIALCVLRYLGGQTWGNEGLVTRVYLPFILFTVYCVLVTVIMPQIMAGRLLVWPQRMDIFEVRVPLYFGTGNISQLSYVVFTMIFCFLVTCYVGKKPWLAERLLNVSFASGYAVVLFGFWQLANKLVGVYFPEEFFYSNPSASMAHEQMLGDAIRVVGSFTEPAALAGHVCGTLYATFWLILAGDQRRFVLCLFVLSTILLLLSTSTTGYIVLAVGLPGMMALAATFGTRRALLRLLKVFLGAMVVLTTMIVAVPYVSPDLATRATSVVNATLDKQESDSYDERTTWDNDALSVVAPTFGFGAGWGSVRSSSLAPAILGGTGLWGFGLFAWFVCRLISVIRRTRRRLADQPAQSRVMEALSASAVAILLDALLSGPNLNAMEAWLPLAAALGIVVRAGRTQSPPPRALVSPRAWPVRHQGLPEATSGWDAFHRRP